jgi:hypothetical protein
MYVIENDCLYLKNDILDTSSIIKIGDKIPLIFGNVVVVKDIKPKYIIFNNDTKLSINLFVQLVNIYFII